MPEPEEVTHYPTYEPRFHLGYTNIPPGPKPTITASITLADNGESIQLSSIKSKEMIDAVTQDIGDGLKFDETRVGYRLLYIIQNWFDLECYLDHPLMNPKPSPRAPRMEKAKFWIKSFFRDPILLACWSGLWGQSSLGLIAEVATGKHSKWWLALAIPMLAVAMKMFLHSLKVNRKQRGW